MYTILFSFSKDSTKNTHKHAIKQSYKNWDEINLCRAKKNVYTIERKKRKKLLSPIYYYEFFVFMALRFAFCCIQKEKYWANLCMVHFPQRLYLLPNMNYKFFSIFTCFMCAAERLYCCSRTSWSLPQNKITCNKMNNNNSHCSQTKTHFK